MTPCPPAGEARVIHEAPFTAGSSSLPLSRKSSLRSALICSPWDAHAFPALAQGLPGDFLQALLPRSCPGCSGGTPGRGGGGWAVWFARCPRPKEPPSEGPGAAGTLPRLRQLGHTQAQSSASSPPGPGWFCILGPTPLAPAFKALQPFHWGWPQRSGSSQGVSHGTHRRAHRRGAGAQASPRRGPREPPPAEPPQQRQSPLAVRAPAVLHVSREKKGAGARDGFQAVRSAGGPTWSQTVCPDGETRGPPRKRGSGEDFPTPLRHHHSHYLSPARSPRVTVLRGPACPPQAVSSPNYGASRVSSSKHSGEKLQGVLRGLQAPPAGGHGNHGGRDPTETPQRPQPPPPRATELGLGGTGQSDTCPHPCTH